MDKKRLELKVGIFVSIAIILFTMVVFSINDINVFLKKGYEIKTIFGFVNGIEVAAPVRLAGVTVGEVKEVKRFYDRELAKDQVEVLIWLRSDVKIKRDAEIYINMLGMLGEKYIEIFSSGSEQAGLLKNGDEIIGYDPIPIERLARINEENLVALHGLLTGSETKRSLKEILSNTKQITENLKEITDRINKGEGTLGRLVNDDRLYRNLEDFSKDIKAHPWKLLIKQKTKTTDDTKKKSTIRKKRRILR
ncbi:MAG: MlaD family protein [Candidatus Omnitrophota bacterium]|nr:MlaD family protein [Candidatus Omnitrophota bacterium]